MEDYIIKNFHPDSLFKKFEDISAIPRGSFNEGKIADYIENFARSRKLKCSRDSFNNILVTVPATSGFEDRAPILIQGHMDMVCEKNADCQHDFSTSGLDLYVDEKGWLRAKGTTLGADDGVALMVMLEIMDSKLENHPMCECLFTVQEEVGLLGADAFDCAKIQSRRMLNIDSAELDYVVAGSAGGLRSDITLPLDSVELSGNAVRLKISGLSGGHSGENINCGRANANKIMADVLSSLAKIVDFNLVSFCGGTADNAIPRECNAVISVEKTECVFDFAKKAEEKISKTLVDDDCAFKLECCLCDGFNRMLNKYDTERIISFLSLARNGIFEMNAHIEGAVEYSRNLGIAMVDESEANFSFLTRSSVSSRLDDSENELERLAKTFGGSIKHPSRYPGWNFDSQSMLREKYIEAFKNVLGYEPKVITLHAGLEVGLIKGRIPDMEIISVGPDILNLHSPDEALSLSSMQSFWQVITELLKNL